MNNYELTLEIIQETNPEKPSKEFYDFYNILKSAYPRSVCMRELKTILQSTPENIHRIIKTMTYLVPLYEEEPRSKLDGYRFGLLRPLRRTEEVELFDTIQNFQRIKL